MPSVGQTVDGMIDLLAGGEKGFRAFSGLLQAGMMQAAASGAVASASSTEVAPAPAPTRVGPSEALKRKGRRSSRREQEPLRLRHTDAPADAVRLPAPDAQAQPPTSSHSVGGAEVASTLPPSLSRITESAQTSGDAVLSSAPITTGSPRSEDVSPPKLTSP